MTLMPASGLWARCGFLLVMTYAGSASAQQIVSELRLGALAHDVPVLAGQKELGTDINGELLFVSPIPEHLVSGVSPALRWLLTPRPIVGIDANTSGATSQLYFGLAWSATLFGNVLIQSDSLFLGLGFGPAFNNGRVSTLSGGRKSLGSNVLFHESVELGDRFDPRHSVSLYFEHSSNAGLARENEGLDNAGIRFGLAF
jgi:lipid A 3-O-deacylase